MKKSDLLKQKRMALLQRQQVVYKLVETENRELTPEEQTELDDADGEVERLDAEIVDAEKHEARQLRIAGLTGRNVGGESGELDKVVKRYSFLNAARAAADGSALTGVEKEMNEEAIREAKSLSLEFNTSKRSFSIPSTMVRATAQTVTEDDGKFGGKLVAQESRLVDGFIPRLFLEEAGASVLTGLVGNVSLPKFSDYEYNWLSEREAVTLKAEDIDGPILKPRRAAAGVAISQQLLAQTSVGVENIIYNKLREAAARALNSAALNGDGNKAPLGILNMDGIQLAKALEEQAVSYDIIVELWGLIAGANADSGNEVFILNSNS